MQNSDRLRKKIPGTTTSNYATQVIRKNKNS